MIIVCSLPDHRNVCESVNASHLISVVDPGYEPETPYTVKNHLKLGFDDIINIDPNNSIFRLNIDKIPQLLPSSDHVDSIIEFTKEWNNFPPIVIHCWCGVSRSMAVATFILCKINSNNVEANIRYMRSIAPHANPNKLMLSMFENYLEVEGQINETFNKYPHTVTYDCSTNFAPITIFNFNDMKEFI